MRIHRPGRRLVAVLALLLAAGAAWGQAADTPENAPLALVGAVAGAIGPGTERHVADIIDTAEERGAEVAILRLDTPGGLVTSTRRIVSKILSSSVPVIGYVAPSGAHAASAGTYIMYATHVAVMAPGTNLGAATPVQIGGGSPLSPGGKDAPEKDTPGKDGGSDAGNEADKDNESGDGNGSGAPAMSKKAVNDAVAWIRSLAEMHGRNAEWAEKAVREAASLTSTKAQEMGVVDLTARDVAELLEKIHGREVAAGSATRTLDTQGARVEHVEPSAVTKFLSLLSNPNVALILMMIGIYGLIFEFANPGSLGPGIDGAICLVLGLYALNQLPLNYAGLALIGLGIAFMVAEAFTPTFGVLGAGGLAAFIIGAAMLVDTDVPAFQISWWVIGATAAVSGGVLAVLLGYVWRVYRRPGEVRDSTGMIGAEARVLDWTPGTGTGHAQCRGETWQARSEAVFAANEIARVAAVDGLTLVLEQAAAAPSDAADTLPAGGPAGQQGG